MMGGARRWEVAPGTLDLRCISTNAIGEIGKLVHSGRLCPLEDHKWKIAQWM